MVRKKVNILRGYEMFYTHVSISYSPSPSLLFFSASLISPKQCWDKSRKNTILSVNLLREHR